MSQILWEVASKLCWYAWAICWSVQTIQTLQVINCPWNSWYMTPWIRQTCHDACNNIHATWVTNQNQAADQSCCNTVLVCSENSILIVIHSRPSSAICTLVPFDTAPTIIKLFVLMHSRFSPFWSYWWIGVCDDAPNLSIAVFLDSYVELLPRVVIVLPITWQSCWMDLQRPQGRLQLSLQQHSWSTAVFHVTSSLMRLNV